MPAYIDDALRYLNQGAYGITPDLSVLRQRQNDAIQSAMQQTQQQAPGQMIYGPTGSPIAMTSNGHGQIIPAVCTPDHPCPTGEVIDTSGSDVGYPVDLTPGQVAIGVPVVPAQQFYRWSDGSLHTTPETTPLITTPAPTTTTLPVVATSSIPGWMLLVGGLAAVWMLSKE